MPITTDRNDPRLNDHETGQNTVYLVLPDDERQKGFIRPVRDSYLHVGVRPKHPLADLTEEQKERTGGHYAKFEAYPEDDPLSGRYWTQAQLDSGCGTLTKMGTALAETYARDPKFYGATFCIHCNKHFPVEEFVWEDGTVVGS